MNNPTPSRVFRPCSVLMLALGLGCTIQAQAAKETIGDALQFKAYQLAYLQAYLQESAVSDGTISLEEWALFKDIIQYGITGNIDKRRAEVEKAVAELRTKYDADGSGRLETSEMAVLLKDAKADTLVDQFIKFTAKRKK